jgi:transposase-like protein
MEGSEKQIAWAEKIQAEKIEEINKLYQNAKELEDMITTLAVADENPENEEKWDEKIQKTIDNRIAVERLAIELGFEQCPSCHKYYENTDNWHYNGDSYVCPKCDR